MFVRTRAQLRGVGAVGAATLLAGCAALAGPEDDGTQRAAAAFYPLAWVTERVAGDGWQVENLTSPGGEPHDLELSIEATATVADADLVVHLGGFQPAVDDSISANAQGAVLDAADAVELRSMADHEHHGEAGHDHGDEDPHFWLDPERMAALAEAVADRLAALDSDGADVYRANAAELVAELDALDREYADGLAGCERDVVVVSHDAFGYLEKYGLRLAPIAGLSPDAEPTPATLAGLSGLIRDEGLTTVFTERLASPAMAQALATDLGVETRVLDPIEGLTDETADEDYLSLMRSNLRALEEANGC